MPFSNDPKKQMKRNLDAFAASSLKIARKALVAKASDVRKAVQSSLKSGGKNQFSKTYQSSKPGEPPKTHGRRLKSSIRYEIETPDKIKVGAPSISGSKTARVLEKGGEGSFTETKQKSDYFERRKARAKAQASKERKASKAGEAIATKPKAKRPFYVRGENGEIRRVGKYERFTSERAAKRAEASSEFQRWRDSVQRTTTVKVTVAPRPFVEPAAKKESDPAREKARFERIARRSN